MQSSKQKKKEPIPELESKEESTAKDTGNLVEDNESEEEEPATPPPEKKKGYETWSSTKKKAASAVKTPIAPKQPYKTPKKEGSSHKKAREK